MTSQVLIPPASQISLISTASAERPKIGQANELYVFEAFELENLAHTMTLHHWTPGTFHEIEYYDKNETPQKGRRRTIENCIGVDVLGFDIDSGLSIEAAKKICAPYRHILLTSRNHQKEKRTKGGKVSPACDRFRIVLFLSRRITNDTDYKATWFKLQQELLPAIDPACKDICRFFYASPEVIQVQQKGALIEPEIAPTPPQIEEKPDGRPRKIKGKLAKTTLSFLVNLSEPGTLHNTMVKALFDMREQGYSQQEAGDKFEMAFESNGEDFGTTETDRIQDIYNNRDAKYPARWPVTYKTKSGEFKPDAKAKENYAHLFECQKLSLKWNDMTQSVYIDRADVTKKGAAKELVQLDDTTIHDTCIAAREAGLLSSKEIMMEYFSHVARKNSYHPIKTLIQDQMENLDPGRDYIKDFISTMQFKIDSESDESVKIQIARMTDYVEMWLVGIMAKLYRPGAQNLVLVLQGKQGIGKSRWLAKLALWDEAFGEGEIDPGNKDHELRHLTHFIWHVPELDNVTSKRESSALKDYLTKDFINVRPAYARMARKGRSICSFCASVNATEFLSDWTGNRRFLVMPLLKVDAGHGVPMAKVFAQAKRQLDNGYRYWLNEAEIEDLNRFSQQFVMENPVNHIAAQISEGPDFATVHDLFSWFEYRPKGGADYGRMRAALRNRGIKSSRQRINGANIRGFLVDRSKLGSMNFLHGVKRHH